MLRNKTWVLFAVLAIVTLGTQAQSNSSRALITQTVDESKLTVLKGNTHPLARAEFDRGMAPNDMPMERMLLVLKRSPAQEAALEKLLAEQQDRTSPNFHKWLTPEQFGQEFGPSDTDIETITEWLETRGFQVTNVAKGRDVIEFSGTAGQVQAAFHTEIHRYFVNGENHWANASDPQIPSALAPAVAGVATLHDFLKKPQSHNFGIFTKSRATGDVSPLRPALTFPGNCGLNGTTCYALGPYDFAQIYNVLPEWNAGSSIDGSGQHIGIVGRSDIALADVQNFRSLFGLPAKAPNIIVNGPDPGLGAANGDEGESDLDVQWAGGVARNATIDFVTSKSAATDGVDLSAEYIVDNNLDPILSYSYGLCEAQMGSSDLMFHNDLWEKAQAEGITVIVATGDTGATLCENPSNMVTTEQPATTGLAVNGVAATPYDVAVGGTDFDDFNNWAPYWSSNNNSTTEQSAIQYIPEMAYNDSCTNAVLGQDGFSANAEANCNNVTQLAGFIAPFGGGGGASTVYTKPTWQTGPGVPSDGARDLPDLSMYAGDGTMVGSFYVVCEADAGGSCVVSNGSTSFSAVGGTSASTQVFGGVMALVEQKANGRQGLPNANFYALAAAQPTASCNSSAPPLAICTFNDVTVGTIAMPCVTGSPNCVTNTNGDANGITSGFNTGVGYDEATGLGSVNVANLVNATGWTQNNGPLPDYTLSSTSPSVTVNSQGGTGTLSLTLTAVNGYTGTFNLSPTMCSALPAETTCSFSTNSVTINAQNPTATFTATFQTTAPSMLAPFNRLAPPAWSPKILASVLPFLLAIAMLVWRLRNNRRMWTLAMAAALFVALVPVVSCGGGGGGGGGGGCGQGGVCTGGTPTGTTNGVVTLQDSPAAPATPIVHSIVFSMTVN
jgi:subtilase family serine protease